MKNETKLKKLMAWLDENHIEYKEAIRYKKTKKPKYTALVIKVAGCMIANVKISSENDAVWFEKHKRYSPIFIRTKETPSFLLEKVQNVIIDLMKKLQEKSMLTSERISRRKEKR